MPVTCTSVYSPVNIIVYILVYSIVYSKYILLLGKQQIVQYILQDAGREVFFR